MTTIYLVNEKPDGSGRWLDPGDNCAELWSDDCGVFYTSRERADYAVKACGGHVVEFTMGAKPEPREPDHWVARDEDGDFALEPHSDTEMRFATPGDAAYHGDPVPVYAPEPPPAPPAEREPDYWLARDEDGVYVGDLENGDMYDSPTNAFAFWHRAFAERYGTPVPVYVGEPPPNPAWHNGYQEAVNTFAAAFGLQSAVDDVSDVMAAIAEGDGWGRFVERVRAAIASEPPPAPAEREPDAIMVCHSDGSPDWGDVRPAPRPPLPLPRMPTRKVYLDTPPREEWSALKALLAKMTEEKDAALAEVSRLSTALDATQRALARSMHDASRLSKKLDEARRETESVRVAARELQRKLDEMAKQEPVAWRRRAPLGEMFLYARKPSDESLSAWRQRGHEVEPLYAAPQAPAAEPDRSEHDRGYRNALGVTALKLGIASCGPFEDADKLVVAIRNIRQTAEPSEPEAEPAPADTPAANEEPDGWLGSWCPQCGPDVGVDEGGLCNSCGATAVGEGADHAIRLLRREAAPADTSAVDLTAKFAAWEAGEPTPDTPAMVEARRLIAEGWIPLVTGNPWRLRYAPFGGRADIFVAPAVADAMRALKGGDK